jgi:predicted transcriptional regulator
MAKKKVGRPKDKDPKKNVPLRLRDSLRSKVEEAAAKAERSLSYMLEKAVEEKYS